jgi:DMSO reductase anchor subunit
MDAMQFTLEAQSVIGMRLTKALWGGPAAHDEAALMVAEKTAAALDAHCLILRSLLAGEGHLGPARAMALYRRRVRANQRRLVAGG